MSKFVSLVSCAGVPWHYLHEPLIVLSQAIGSSCAEMCSATAKVMEEFPDQDALSKLEKAIEATMNARLGITLTTFLAFLDHYHYRNQGL
jgi:hypothetical protein